MNIHRWLIILGRIVLVAVPLGVCESLKAVAVGAICKTGIIVHATAFTVSYK